MTSPALVSGMSSHPSFFNPAARPLTRPSSVPAFAISPYIAPNTLIHDKGTNYANNSAYTHTSFLHFLQNLWGLEGLNNRVQWARTFEYIFQDEPRQDAMETLPTPVWYGGSGQPEPDAFYKLNQPYSYYASQD